MEQVCARFGNWQLEGYEMSDRIQPGQSLPVTLYGYGLGPGSITPVAVEVVGRDGIVVGRQAAGLEWVQGAVNRVTLSVPVAADAFPARAVVRAGILAPDSGQWRAATSVSGRLLETPLPLTTLKIAPLTPLVARPKHLVQTTFGDKLRLLGYDLASDGRVATVTLYWQALSAMGEQDYTTFIHLLDSTGQLVIQADGQPQEGEYPTSVWDTGEIVADVKMIRLSGHQPAPPPVVPFRLVAGVYLLPTGERLNTSPAQGASGDVFLLRQCPEITACFRNP
jgi:hypothetical protein